MHNKFLFIYTGANFVLFHDFLFEEVFEQLEIIGEQHLFVLRALSKNLVEPFPCMHKLERILKNLILDLHGLIRRSADK